MFSYNLTLFTSQFLLYYILYLSTFLQPVKNKLNSIENKRLLWIGIGVFHLITILLIRYQIGDVFLFSSAGRYLRQRIDFYWIDSDHGQYPFFPFLIFIHALLTVIQDFITFLPFSFYLKIILLGCLYYVTWYIYRPHQSSIIIPIRFLISPITYSIVLYHGQIDIILIAFLLPALYLYTQDTKLLTLGKATILYGLSVASKTWSLLLLPLLINSKRSLLHLFTLTNGIGVILLAITFIYTRYVFGSSIRTVLPAVTHPGGPLGVWGVTKLLSLFLPALELFLNYRLLYLLVAVGLVHLLLLKKKFPLKKSILLFVYGFYIITPNWGIQYLIWHYPFLYLMKASYQTKVDTIVYIVFIPLYLYLSYFNITAEELFFSKSLIEFLGVFIWVFFIWKFLIAFRTS